MPGCRRPCERHARMPTWAERDTSDILRRAASTVRRARGFAHLTVDTSLRERCGGVAAMGNTNCVATKSAFRIVLSWSAPLPLLASPLLRVLRRRRGRVEIHGWTPVAVRYMRMYSTHMIAQPPPAPAVRLSWRMAERRPSSTRLPFSRITHALGCSVVPRCASRSRSTRSRSPSTVKRLRRSGEPTMRPRSSLTPAAPHAASRTFMPSLDFEKYMYSGGTFASSGKMMPRCRRLFDGIFASPMALPGELAKLSPGGRFGAKHAQHFCICLPVRASRGASSSSDVIEGEDRHLGPLLPAGS